MRYLLTCMLLTVAQAQVRTVTAADVTFQPLASITNDRSAELQSLGVLLDAGQVVGLRFETINGNNPHESDLSIDDMKAGAVLGRDAKHKAILLRASFDSTVGNADVVITYPSNALLGKHKDCRASIVRDERGQWHIVNIYDHKWVDHLVVQTSSLGISTIDGICPR